MSDKASSASDDGSNRSSPSPESTNATTCSTQAPSRYSEPKESVDKKELPAWVENLDQAKVSEKRQQPWKEQLGSRVGDNHFMAFKAWDSDPTDTDPFKSLGDTCKECGGKGCSACRAPWTFAG